MAHAKSDRHGRIYPRTRTFGTAAVNAGQQFAWIWSRESLLRLGLSFVLATALWLYVTSKQDPTQAYDYPPALQVTAQNIRDNLTITNNLDVVHVRIQANQNTTPVSPTSFHTYVDLNGYGRGLHLVKVRVLPDPGIQVVSVKPNAIQVMLDAVSAQQKPVQVHISGHPPQGYELGTWQASPSTVQIRGPETALSQVDHAAVYVLVNGATSTVHDSYSVTLEDKQGITVPGRLLKTTPSQVTVTVPIKALSSYKTLPVVASLHGQPKRGFGVVSLTAEPGTVIANGSPTALAQVTKVTTSPISVSNRGGGTFATRVRLQLPHGVSSNVKFVTVKAQIQPVDSSSSIELGITPLNVGTGLNVHMQSSKVLATVVGPSNALQSAARKGRATIDLTGYGAGTFYVRPVITVPGLQVEGMYPSAVAVTLTYSSTG